MKVEVKLFSILRDCLPAEAKEGKAIIAMPESAALSDLMVRLGIDRKLGYPPQDIIARAGWQVIVNGGFESNMDRLLRDEDYVQIFPPVAGG